MTDVFCAHGFEGASLSRIAEATGLQRASLYHRFPKGKQQMADAVLARTDVWFMEHILAPMQGEGTPAARLAEVIRRLSAFYVGGRKSCLLDTLSIGQEEGVIRDHVKATLEAWRGVFAAAAREAGATAAAARNRAEQAIASIQGGLVLARVLGEPRPFTRALRDLPGVLLGEG